MHLASDWVLLTDLVSDWVFVKALPMDLAYGLVSNWGSVSPMASWMVLLMHWVSEMASGLGCVTEYLQQPQPVDRFHYDKYMHYLKLDW